MPDAVAARERRETVLDPQLESEDPVVPRHGAKRFGRLDIAAQLQGVGGQRHLGGHGISLQGGARVGRGEGHSGHGCDGARAGPILKTIR
jgi:hypothetical protein